MFFSDDSENSASYFVCALWMVSWTSHLGALASEYFLRAKDENPHNQMTFDARSGINSIK
jgi:hypothetical protein